MYGQFSLWDRERRLFTPFLGQKNLNSYNNTDDVTKTPRYNRSFDDHSMEMDHRFQNIQFTRGQYKYKDFLHLFLFLDLFLSLG